MHLSSIWKIGWPRISGVPGIWIVDAESKGGQVTMELEMQWDGNPRIELDIRTRVGVGLPVEVILFTAFCCMGLCLPVWVDVKFSVFHGCCSAFLLGFGS